MKIIFMGTPDFSVPSLKSIDDHYGVDLVITQPDKQKGRGKKLQASPVKEEALKRNLKVLQPERLRKDEEVIAEMKALQPDFIIVVAYGQILSEEVLSIPKYGSINLHASLLPKLRGAAPLNFALMEGHQESGATTMLMDKGLDTGDMLLTYKVKLLKDMNVEDLHDELSEHGGDLLIKTMEGLVDGTIKPVKQNHEQSTYAPLLTKENMVIDWSRSAVEINQQIRGLSPYPGAFTYGGEDKIKILKARVVESVEGPPGVIVHVTPEGILVSTGKAGLLILEFQMPGKKPMRVETYLNGNVFPVSEFKRRDK